MPESGGRNVGQTRDTTCCNISGRTITLTASRTDGACYSSFSFFFFFFCPFFSFFLFASLTSSFIPFLSYCLSVSLSLSLSFSLSLSLSLSLSPLSLSLSPLQSQCSDLCPVENQKIKDFTSDLIEILFDPASKLFF